MPLDATSSTRSRVIRVVASWLGSNRMGLVVMALVVGAGAGLGAAGFRELILFFTWLATGHTQFGQQGHAPSLHLRFLGIWFVLAVPVLGGLLYGPLIQRFAREARGHGVPEVMLAVAENGGRIRPPVTIVKALASTLGQWVRMSEHRLRIIVACGAAGGIAATFNAPITGLFFGFEIVLREFSLDALFTTSLAAVAGDVISRAFFGSAPFFTAVPHDLTITNDGSYLLVAVLAIVAGLIGLTFKTVLYGMEDRADALWRGRPEWARPAVGGVLLGLILLALPQMYGVGYPVMDSVIAGHVVVGLILLFLVGKIVAASLTLSIGGSGGVFAPSLFIGTMAGMAFGVAAHHIFGPAVGPPALYAVVAMGGVFAGAAQAPLTAIASVVEMTGNFTLTLPIMLASGIAAAVSKQLSYGSVYTTKLLRRGIDIERPRPDNILEALSVADVMQPLQTGDRSPRLQPRGADANIPGPATRELDRFGAVVHTISAPQELFEDETLEQALRQLTLHGRAGLPVLSGDREHLRGWITRRDVLAVLAQSIAAAGRRIEAGAVAADFGADDPERAAHESSAPLEGYEILELSITPGSDAAGRRLGDVAWPPGALVVAVTDRGEMMPALPATPIRTGERVVLLAPVNGNGRPVRPAEGPPPAAR
jgi:CIC family chloride channel protein